MLPYQEDGKKLEKLLERLFEDDELTPDGVEVLRGPGPRPFGSCCTHSYGDYGG
jgi:hypothetical protein